MHPATIMLPNLHLDLGSDKLLTSHSHMISEPHLTQGTFSFNLEHGVTCSCCVGWHLGSAAQLPRPEGYYWRQPVPPHPVLLDTRHEASHAHDSGQGHELAACLCQSRSSSRRCGSGERQHCIMLQAILYTLNLLCTRQWHST